MSSPTKKPLDELNAILFILGWSAFTIMVFMALYHFILVKWVGWDAATRGQFGDEFGAMNAIFSGMAFFGLIIAIIYQSKDLRAQTSALQLQQETLKQQIQEFQEQKAEMARSAAAQEEYNTLTKLTLWLEVEKMSHDVGVQIMASGNSSVTRNNSKTALLSRVAELKKIMKDRDLDFG